MDDRAQCPFCMRYVQIRKDGRLPKHRVSSRNHRGGKPCAASELALEDDRAKRAAGEKPSPVDAGETNPEDIF